MNKVEKKLRENILRERILNARKNEGISYTYFVKLLDYFNGNFSTFVAGNRGISRGRIETLEKFFGIKEKKSVTKKIGTKK